MAQVDEYARARPSPALRPYVAFYTGYRQRGLAPGVHRGLPSPYLTLIFTIDEPLVVAAHPDPRQAPGHYDTLLGGLHLTPALIACDGAQSGVQVAVSPLGCRALLGMPAGEIAGQDVDTRAVLGAVADEVQERIRYARTWPARFAAVDAVLSGLAADAVTVHPDVAHVWRRLLDSGGALPVTALAGDVGWSARHLTDRFRTEVGLGLKAAARVIRFDRARRLIGRDGAPLARVAADTGYFDQAHLAREFRDLAGCSPSRWLADEAGGVVTSDPDDFGSVQAGGAAADDDGVHDRRRPGPSGVAHPAGA